MRHVQAIAIQPGCIGVALTQVGSRLKKATNISGSNRQVQGAGVGGKGVEHAVRYTERVGWSGLKEWQQRPSFSNCWYLRGSECAHEWKLNAGASPIPFPQQAWWLRQRRTGASRSHSLQQSDHCQTQARSPGLAASPLRHLQSRTHQKSHTLHCPLNDSPFIPCIARLLELRGRTPICIFDQPCKKKCPLPIVAPRSIDNCGPSSAAGNDWGFACRAAASHLYIQPF